MKTRRVLLGVLFALLILAVPAYSAFTTCSCTEWQDCIITESCNLTGFHNYANVNVSNGATLGVNITPLILNITYNFTVLPGSYVRGVGGAGALNLTAGDTINISLIKDEGYAFYFNFSAPNITIDCINMSTAEINKILILNASRFATTGEQINITHGILDISVTSDLVLPKIWGPDGDLRIKANTIYVNGSVQMGGPWGNGGFVNLTAETTVDVMGNITANYLNSLSWGRRAVVWVYAPVRINVSGNVSATNVNGDGLWSDQGGEVILNGSIVRVMNNVLAGGDTSYPGKIFINASDTLDVRGVIKSAGDGRTNITVDMGNPFDDANFTYLGAYRIGGGDPAGNVTLILRNSNSMNRSVNISGWGINVISLASNITIVNITDGNYWWWGEYGLNITTNESTEFCVLGTLILNGVPGSIENTLLTAVQNNNINRGGTVELKNGSLFINTTQVDYWMKSTGAWGELKTNVSNFINLTVSAGNFISIADDFNATIISVTGGWANFTCATLNATNVTSAGGVLNVSCSMSVNITDELKGTGGLANISAGILQVKRLNQTSSSGVIRLNATDINITDTIGHGGRIYITTPNNLLLPDIVAAESSARHLIIFGNEVYIGGNINDGSSRDARVFINASSLINISGWVRTDASCVTAGCTTGGIFEAWAPNSISIGGYVYASAGSAINRGGTVKLNASSVTVQGAVQVGGGEYSYDHSEFFLNASSYVDIRGQILGASYNAVTTIVMQLPKLTETNITRIYAPYSNSTILLSGTTDANIPFNLTIGKLNITSLVGTLTSLNLSKYNYIDVDDSLYLGSDGSTAFDINGSLITTATPADSDLIASLQSNALQGVGMLELRAGNVNVSQTQIDLSWIGTKLQAVMWLDVSLLNNVSVAGGTIFLNASDINASYFRVTSGMLNITTNSLNISTLYMSGGAVNITMPSWQSIPLNPAGGTLYLNVGDLNITNITGSTGTIEITGENITVLDNFTRAGGSFFLRANRSLVFNTDRQLVATSATMNIISNGAFNLSNISLGASGIVRINTTELNITLITGTATTGRVEINASSVCIKSYSQAQNLSINTSVLCPQFLNSTTTSGKITLNFTKLVYENVTEVDFGAQVLNVNGTLLGRGSNITNNLVYINTDVNPGLNVAANISLKNLTGMLYPYVVKDGAACPVGECAITGRTRGSVKTLNFSVSGFSTYYAGDVNMSCSPEANWTIDQYVVCIGGEYTVNNLTIAENGTLILAYAVLTMNPGIGINASGNFTSESNIINGSTYYNFIVRSSGNLTMYGTNVSNATALTLYSSASTIEKSKIEQGRDDGIQVFYANPVIFDSEILFNNGTGILNSFANSTIYNCTIANNSRSGVVNINSSAQIYNNTIVNNSGSGIGNWEANASISFNIIENNTLSGVYNYYSTPQIYNNSIQTNMREGVCDLGGYGALFNNTLTSNSRYGIVGIDSVLDISNQSLDDNSLGRGMWGWLVYAYVNDTEGVAIKNANVTVYNSLGANASYNLTYASATFPYTGDVSYNLSISEFLSNETGWVNASSDSGPIPFVLFQNLTENGGSAVNYNEHNITARKGNATNSTLFNITSSRTVVLTIYLSTPYVEFAAPTPVNNTNVSGVVIVNTSATDTNDIAVTEIFVDYVNVYNCTNSFVCEYSLNTTPLADGNHTFYGRVNSTAEKTNETEVRNFTVDNSAPLIYGITLSNGAAVPGEKILIGVNASDELTGISAVYANVSWGSSSELIELPLNASGWFSANFSNTSVAALYTVTILVNNTAGAVNNTNTTTFRIIAASPFYNIPEASKYLVVGVSGECANETATVTVTDWASGTAVEASIRIFYKTDAGWEVETTGSGSLFIFTPVQAGIYEVEASYPGYSPESEQFTTLQCAKVSACIENADCPNGYCDVATGTCASCTADEQCDSNLCVNGACFACTAYFQCESNYCKDGVCTSCSSDNECPTGLCKDGVCAECEGDDECLSDLCVSGRCLPCTANWQCESGLCKSGICTSCSNDLECSPQLCLDGKCSYCTSNEQCSKTNYCNVDSGLCECKPGGIECGENAECCGKNCIEETKKCASCTSDAECPFGFCENGECRCSKTDLVCVSNLGSNAISSTGSGLGNDNVKNETPPVKVVTECQLNYACSSEEDCCGSPCLSGKCSCSVKACYSSAECCEGYCSEGKCTGAPKLKIAYLETEIKDGCSGIAENVGGFGVLLCNGIWAVLPILALLGGFSASRKYDNKLVQVAAVLLPLLVALLVIPLLGIGVALLEVVYIFTRKKSSGV
ncbi:MAG: right-handed parallel beta-helix repeat-containing protein [Candidatus Micrarchaeota archaeon]